MFFSSSRDEYKQLLEDAGLPMDRDAFWVKYPNRFKDEITKMRANTIAVFT